MSQDKPEVGKLYSPMEQSRMHGGNPQMMLPYKKGKITLVRFHPGEEPGRAVHH